MWVVAQDAGRLLRLDSATGETVDRVDIGPGARLVTSGKRWLYVSHYRDGRVLRVDPENGEIVRSPHTCGGPQGMALADGRLWVACSVDATVLGLDPDTLEVLETLEAADAPDAVTVAPDGRVLVASQTGPTLLVFDPTDPAGAEQVPLGGEDQLYDQANIDLAVTGGQVHVSSFASDVLLRAPLP
jgi:streptogramin lyase